MAENMHISTDLSAEEYRQLRAAIAARGHLRALLFLAGLAGWTAALVAVLVLLPYPLASMIPLALLLAAFEAIRPLHFGAERIGRFLQVFYEERGDSARPRADTPSWERCAMSFGGATPGAAGHPLYLPVFLIAVVLNYLAVILPGPVAAELALLAIPHAAFVLWLLIADRAVRTQRERELQRYRDLRG
jgi:hypothetical protein